MKNITKSLIGAFAMGLLFMSCSKEMNEITYQGGTAPVAAASNVAPTVLLKVNENNVWSTFSWTNPNYTFTTGVSSQDVTYTIQIDTTGANFTNPKLQEIVIAKDLSHAVTVKEINTALAKLDLKEDIPHNVEFRIKSTLANNTVPLYSNVIKVVLTPYLDVAVPLPSSGDLFLVGDATPGGWNNPVPLPSQKFTKTSSTTYEITVALTGGKEYLMLPVNGDWSHKYAVKDKNVAGLNAGGDFNLDASDNIPGPSASGNYKIVAEFKTGRFTVTKL